MVSASSRPRTAQDGNPLRQNVSRRGAGARRGNYRAEMSTAAAREGSSIVKILVVDGRTRGRNALLAMLSSLDCLVVESPSLPDALKQLVRHDFAIVIIGVLDPENRWIRSGDAGSPAGSDADDADRISRAYYRVGGRQPDRLGRDNRLLDGAAPTPI